MDHITFKKCFGMGLDDMLCTNNALTGRLVHGFRDRHGEGELRVVWKWRRRGW